MSDLLEAIKQALIRECQMDYSWKYIPEEAKEDIIRMHIEKIAEWLVNQTHVYRKG